MRSNLTKWQEVRELISHSSCAKKLNCCLTIHSSTMPTTSPGGRAWARNTIWTEPYQCWPLQLKFEQLWKVPVLQFINSSIRSLCLSLNLSLISLRLRLRQRLRIQLWLEIWLQSLFKAVAVKPVWIGHCPWSSQNNSNGIAFPFAQVALES